VSTFKTGFTGEDHGFDWANDFRGEDIVASWFDQELLTTESAGHMLGLVQGGPAHLLTPEMLDITEAEVIEEIGDLLDVGGLSAGICMVALDRYEAGKSPWKRKPGRRSKNFARLAAKHFEVFGDMPRLIEMTSHMSRPDVAHTWDETRSLGDLSTDVWWPRARRSLVQGNPVPLLLIRSRWNPFANHVVVATGYREVRDGKDVRIEIYDPNHPSEPTRLVVNLGRLNSFRLEPKSVYGPGWRKVRGFKRVRSGGRLSDDRASAEFAAQLAAMA